MARHVIPIDLGDTPEIIWDDEAGTVEGDGEFAERLRAQLAQELPLRVSDYVQSIVLHDPAHNPDDFLRLLPAWCWPGGLGADRMPAILRGATPTEGTPHPPPRGIFDGVERDLIPGKEYLP